MTTIIYNHETKEIGCDSQSSRGPHKHGDVKKLHRIHGHVYGFAGDLANIVLWLKIIKANPFGDLYLGENEALSKCDRVNIGGLVFNPKTGEGYTLAWSKQFKTLTYIPLECTDVIGSGSPFAKGALFAGADTRTALKAAMEFDNHSGGRVHIIGMR